MESMYISYGTFEDLDRCIYDTEEILKKYPGDFGLTLGLKSLKDFRSSAVKEFLRRRDIENDHKAAEVILWLVNNGIME